MHTARVVAFHVSAGKGTVLGIRSTTVLLHGLLVLILFKSFKSSVYKRPGVIPPADLQPPRSCLSFASYNLECIMHRSSIASSDRRPATGGRNCRGRLIRCGRVCAAAGAPALGRGGCLFCTAGGGQCTPPSPWPAPWCGRSSTGERCWRADHLQR